MITLESTALKFKIDQNQNYAELELLDQTLLPHEEKWLRIQSTEQMIEAIKSLRVRGAPLIGVAASLQIAQRAMMDVSKEQLLKECQDLYEARPTAVNLMNCIERLRKTIQEIPSQQNSKIDFSLTNPIIQEALAIFNEDKSLCDKMSRTGAELIFNGDSILTHCNTGGLATAGYGTALGAIITAHQQGKKIHVYVDETRPLLQGARLTAWELQKQGIPMTLISDNMAAQLMSMGKIHKVFVGSDRIAQNGDFANKIGTYSVAVNSFYHRIPFYVVAPETTIDYQCLTGRDIPIEERNPLEVLGFNQQNHQIQWAPYHTPVYNPSFDVTPAELVTGWIIDEHHYTIKDVQMGVFKK